MAKDIKEAKKRAVKEFDKDQLLADVESYNSLREDVAGENQRISTLCQTFEKDRGYNIQGFKKAARFAKMSREGAVDELRTFLDTLSVIGLYPLPVDLVDMAESADDDEPRDGEVLPPNGRNGRGRRASAAH